MISSLIPRASHPALGKAGGPDYITRCDFALHTRRFKSPYAAFRRPIFFVCLWVFYPKILVRPQIFSHPHCQICTSVPPHLVFKGVVLRPPLGSKEHKVLDFASICDSIFVVRRYWLVTHACRQPTFPNKGCEKILFAEYLVHEASQPMDLELINGNKDYTVIRQEFPQQLEPWHHHAQPLVVSRQVFPINCFAKPIYHHRRVHIVVVNPTLVAGVVRRINVNALNLSMITRQQRFEGLQVVAMHNQV